uniref:Niban apoptosis regulator 1a n=1 Tax=Kryptolebias marmoratus TaxID=37003 RepID=A0A3Q3AC69_KRYMA
MGNSADSDSCRHAEAELKAFSLYYRKQFSVARFSQLEDELEQNKQKISQLLKQKGPPEEGEVLYEEGVFYFDDTRKWRERYVVTFIKGVPPRDKLLPTGGTVLTAEEAYMAMVDRCFPDDSSEFRFSCLSVFPVYLRLPYRRDSYFCFRQQAKQATFISFLSDCIRHQNQDFLKKKTCEVQAFLKAIQLYRQDQGKYKAWDMLIGSDVRVMANLVMEKLLPSLEKEMLPRLKAKKTDRKRVWFAIMEDAYIVVQEHLLEGLSALKEDCRTTVRQQEVLIHSEMGQILNTRRQLEEKIRAKVSEDAEKLCSESVQPYLGSVLEEMMEPISSGFMEGRQLSETKMTQACQEVLQGATYEQLKKVLAEMARPNLLSCYQKISSLQDNLKCLQERFSFSNMSGVIHSAQIDLQQVPRLRECVDVPMHWLTFDLIFLQQYNYDSSTVRKRIFQDALVSVTLPFIKKNLAPTCRKELQGLEQMIFSDHSNFIHVENVYENILLDILDKEASKVVSEAASLRKHNLFINNSHSSLSSPPSSPSLVLASPVKTASEALPPSPLVVNGLPPSLQREQRQEKEELQSKATTDASVIETLLGRAKQKEEGAKVCLEAEVPAAKAGETVKEEAGTTEETETNRAKMQETVSVQTEETQTEAEPEIHLKEAEIPLSQTAPTEGESMKSEAPDPRKEPVNPSGEDPQPEDTPQSSEVKLETPSGGEEAAAICIKLKEAAESITASDPNSLDVSVGSDSPHSDLESTGDVSSSSDFLEVAQSPKSSEEMGEDKAAGEEEPTVVQMEGGSSVGDVEASADVKVETPASVDDPTPSPPSETRPPDCIKEIRDLVVEVFEVEQPLHRYPKEE